MTPPAGGGGTGGARAEENPSGFPDWTFCEWCQSWHAPTFKFCKRDTGEPVPEKGWWLL